jgi:uncharacterized delta-60 repeat protein
VAFSWERWRFRRCFALCLVAFPVLTAPGFTATQRARADEAGTDPTFRSGNFGHDPTTVQAGTDLALSPNGRVVLGGTDPNQAFISTPPNGAMKASFGISLHPSTGYLPQPMAIAGDSSNRILVGGMLTTSNGNQISRQWLVERFTAPGAPDASFGTGGTAAIDLAPDTGYEQVRALAIDSAGRILAAGIVGDGPAQVDADLVRYLPDGSLDSSFGGGDGVASVALGAFTQPNDVALDPEGRIVVVGQVSPSVSSPNRPSDFAIFRLSADGALDPNFGAAGSVTTDLGSNDDEARSIALDSLGRLVVGGQSGGKAVLERYLPNGSQDAAFGIGGRVSTGDLSTGRGAQVALPTEPAGRIVATSGSKTGLAVIHVYKENGQPDIAFGDHGTISTGLGVYFSTYPTAVAVDRFNRILITGTANNDEFGDVDTSLFVSRFGGTCGAATVKGTEGPDNLRGTSGRDVIDALAGNDRIRGLGGNDLICGGKGRDRIFGGVGADRLFGEAGRDVLLGGAGRDRLQGGPGRDRVRPGP